ncbi:NAD-dependent succinate-semialdehyde dehydrogenase [Marinobacter nanhaiticus D15-8W]|uniref:NAD-dependent succinate-semialdehyde dehydrogenase n=1 Tax=Marinobacter nanhaiticus D15-8W TaxID=626887 RepID=N6VZ48_9GAMM|nr:NAD-dependent succinate-semialdehyde dehydrogenase [Marinobacter nanhaiticus]ENO15555.1 NAD-dependent succinate-semialdehyde dehydrogenase [Marinobacter nanhaiticus D15-8W]BES73595.1 NAD-dependent succinate-semialdehyde dehydrogenase [Marinobacter nanhaiticus D15-8W]
MIQSPLLKHFDGYIGGQWVTSSGDTFDVYNPATGEVLAQVASMSEDDVQRSISEAKKALKLTEPYDLETRREWLIGIRDALLDNKEEVGRILCLEHGKPLKEAQGEVEYAAGFFDYCAKKIDHLKSHTIEEEPKNCTWTVHYRPIGVAGLITPWNFPIGMIAKKLSASLAGGCPSVIKPASETPLTMIALFSLMHDVVKMPPGMVSLVMGKSSMIGKVFCESPDMPMLSFTGSTEVGRTLMENSTGWVKKLALELGGNAPFIVFEDADLESAADNLIANKFRGSGQTCVCANRIYVQESIVESFSEKVAERVNKMTVGDGMKEGVDIGPLINKAGFDKVRTHVEDALEKGGKLVAGKEPSALSGNDLFYPPTVVSGINRNMLCTQEETFGPLVPMVTFRDDDEVIEAGNDTEFGLAAYVFTGDEARASRVISGLRFGHVGWNTGTGPTPEAPFGGMKASGVGREGGIEGLFEFVEPQTVPRGDRH